MSIAQQFRGTGVAMITPFDLKGEVDEARLVRNTEILINNGINYLVVLGTTAETPTLSKEERIFVTRTVVEANGGRVPVILGVGGNDTRSVIREIETLDLEGVDGLLSVAPYYNKPSQEGMYQHFSAIAATSALPLMLYNVPGRTGSNLLPETVLRLANDFPGTIVAIKEASGNLEQVMEIVEGKPGGFLVLSGDDSIALPMIAIGGDGVVSVIANGYPAMMSTMVAAALDGAYDKAREIHYRLLPMMKALFREGNPAGIKASMEVQGMIDNVLRLPLLPVSEKLYGEITRLHGLLND